MRLVDEEVQALIAGRSHQFLKAVEPLNVAAPDGLFADGREAAAVLALQPAIDSANDVPDLLDTVRLLWPAVYVVGPPACVEDHDCDEYEHIGAGEYCSHTTVKVATFADVKRAEKLATLAKAVKHLAEHPDEAEGGLAVRLVEMVTDTYEAIKRWKLSGDD